MKTRQVKGRREQERCWTGVEPEEMCFLKCLFVGFFPLNTQISNQKCILIGGKFSEKPLNRDCAAHRRSVWAGAGIAWGWSLLGANSDKQFFCGYVKVVMVLKVELIMVVYSNSS